jgi:DNA-binding transcriptional MerR regulator
MDVLTQLRSELEELYDFAKEINQTLDRSSNKLSNKESYDKRWLTNREAMTYLGVSKSTLQRYRSDGLLPYSKIGLKLYYKVSDIEALLKQNQT